MTDAPAPGTLRPRGRTERVRLAVVEATRTALQAEGYAGVTPERVADIAGVAKSTVYRRWRDSTGLIAEVLQEIVDERIPLSDSGAIAADLRALALGIRAVLMDPIQGSMVSGLVAAAVENPRAADVLRNFYQRRNEQAAEFVRNAVARGELPPDTDAVEVIRALGAPFYYRMLISQEPFDEADAVRAADAALAAAKAGAYRSGEGRGEDGKEAAG
jgi:AcrR family transcriptional regulator